MTQGSAKEARADACGFDFLTWSQGSRVWSRGEWSFHLTCLVRWCKTGNLYVIVDATVWADVQTRRRPAALARQWDLKRDRRRLRHIAGSLQRELTLALEREAKSEVRTRMKTQ